VALGAGRTLQDQNVPDMVGVIFSAMGSNALIVEDNPKKSEPMTHELVAAIAGERVGSVCRL
jgi:hypothetical protein